MSRQRGVEPPVDEVADLYESNLVAHVVGYLQRVEHRVGSAVVERLAVRFDGRNVLPAWRSRSRRADQRA
jgi:hypothetical protein